MKDSLHAKNGTSVFRMPRDSGILFVLTIKCRQYAQLFASSGKISLCPEELTVSLSRGRPQSCLQGAGAVASSKATVKKIAEGDSEWLEKLVFGCACR